MYQKMYVLLLICLLGSTFVEAEQYWQVDADRNSITWRPVSGEAHADHIEMSGKRVSVVLRYGVNEKGRFELNKSMVWPLLRTVPNNTHASLMRRFAWNPLEDVYIGGKPMDEQVRSVTLDGMLEVCSDILVGKEVVMQLKRIYFPSVDQPSLVEIYEFSNTGKKDIGIEVPVSSKTHVTEAARGVDGSYTIRLCSDAPGTCVVPVGGTMRFAATISACRQSDKPVSLDAEKEWEKRREQVDGWVENLVLDTPDPVVDRMFAFSKIRACESIYETKGGPMHGPGGESYYAAIWANDQAEYINPYFPFVGYPYGNESALNAFSHFARYMNKEWHPIPSSIIAEGEDYWNGAGDRGDAAMIAYGAARYALARGSKEEARQLWPLIEWCLAYCHRNLNEKGVVTSNSDELEGRFPAGKANLCTSSLYYDALLSAAFLTEELGYGRNKAQSYRKQAEQLKRDIDRYFAAEVEGFDTYAYYEGNDVLRSWICIPLTVGIFDRAEGTVNALFSPRLWTENGLLTQAGSTTFWDRSTLYALRGVLMAGETDRAMDFMKRYSAARLLGEHVPYAVEAWPEGGQRHLSAESGLYGRIITEGLFGIRPTGLHTFSLSPRLPKDWPTMALRRIKAFGADFDIEVSRVGKDSVRIVVTGSGRTVIDKTIKEGKSVHCRLFL